MDEARWQTLQLRVFEYQIEEVFQILRQQEIEPILIKGWAAGRFYPNPASRFSSDIDLAVGAADFERAVDIVKKLHYAIDLHKELRHLDKLDWNDLFANSELVEMGKTNVRVLRLEDHLRVLCVHWLTDGGANKDKLWDIFYGLKNRHPDFDWERFLDSAGEKRRRWFVSTVGLAKKYLGLSLDGTPLEKAEDEIPDWVIWTIEKEWKSDVRLIPLQRCLNDKRVFWQQIRKRIPPNPIQATVELEGDFDKKPRVIYQIGNIFIRFFPSIGRITKVLRRVE